uniref:G_PROTEIN_RECEP_F1_2 domain-containing protein n=1 Tax=Rhabditophanes sp. KR3021 TaxID=114890 RepID=A0AC35TIV7_9BILA
MALPGHLVNNNSSPNRNYSNNSSRNHVEMSRLVMPHGVIRDDETSASRRTEKLSDVFTNSEDTTEFMKNLQMLLCANLTDGVYYVILFIIASYGLTCLMIAAFNMPFCRIQPMISVYLLTFGLITILFAITLAMGRCCNESPTRRRIRRAHSTTSQNSKGVLGEVCISGVNAILFIVLIVWTILGAIWVYGNIEFVHYGTGMFEEHYCDPLLYRTAFTTVTLNLLFLVAMIFAMVVLLIYGATKS